MKNDKIISVDYAEEMKQNYLDYSLSVLVGRAIPDVRDGLKVVNRRILYSMHNLNLKNSGPYKKSAKVSGHCLGSYHPHSDTACYGAMVVMAQDFRKNQVLIDPHGNFGQLEDVNSFAHQRYTECRLSKFSEDVMLRDLNKEVVDFVQNYDATDTEPSVLPCKVPQLLLNGAEGIAVGMTTSILPHNLAELVDAEIALMQDQHLTTADLMQYIIGPDMPTGGVVVNKKDLLSIYESGAGKIKLRGKVSVEEQKGGKKRLVIHEIPFTMIGGGISKFLNTVIELADNKTLPEVVDVSNQISKEGVRLVIDLKKDADVDRVKNVLYKKTILEDTFGVNMLAVDQGKPVVLGLKDILSRHIDFRYECETRKYNNLLKKELIKQEIQEGLIQACDIIDLIIEILRGAKNVKDAKSCLMHGDTTNITFRKKTSEKAAENLSFTDVQAQAILDMRLQKLIGLELSELKAEREKTIKNIAAYQNILEHRDVMAKLIIEDLERIKREYGRPRRTTIEDAEEIVIQAPAITEQPLVMVMDKFGYTKTLDLNTYEKNKTTIISEAQHIINCVNISKICIFTNKGQMHQVKVLDIPHTKLRDKGIPIDNISNYVSANEEIVFMCDEKELASKKLLFTTRNGMMKQVCGEEFVVSKRTIAATKLQDDELMSVQFVESKHNIVLSTKDSILLKFPSSEVPEKKKGAVGVRGIKLAKNDVIQDVYLYEDGVETKITYRGKSLTLNRLKTGKRDGAGTKQR
jgi:DNA gyrase subunit A